MTDFLKNVVDPLGLAKNDDIGTVFVMSGSNVIGHRVVTGLLDAGYKHIRVGVWKGNRQLGVDKSVGQTVAEELEGKGASVITFDWTKEDEYKMALAGVNTVFCTLPHMKQFSETFNTFLKACRKAHVEHFVKISFLTEGKAKAYEDKVPAVQFQTGCDVFLTEFRVDTRMTYTILCASHLMSTPLLNQGPVLRDDHKYITASYGMGVNYVSPNDVADAAVVALINRKEHRNKTYNLSGPAPTTDKYVAKLLSKFYGTDIEHVPIGGHEFEDAMKDRGHPEWWVKDAALMEAIKTSGVDEDASCYTKDLETLIGKKPEGFKDYLANKDAMTLQENPSTQVQM